MKQKFITLLLFVMALYIVFAGGGEQIDDSSSTESTETTHNFISDGDFSYTGADDYIYWNG